MADDTLLMDAYAKILGFRSAGNLRASTQEVDDLLVSNPDLVTVVGADGSTLLVDVLQTGNPWLARKIMASVLKSDNPQSVPPEIMAYLNQKDKSGRTALGVAIGKLPEEAALLMNIGVKPTELDINDNNVLHLLAQAKNPKVSYGFSKALEKLDCKTLFQKENKHGEIPAELLADQAAVEVFTNDLGLDKKAIDVAVQRTVKEFVGTNNTYHNVITIENYHKVRKLAERVTGYAEARLYLGPQHRDVWAGLGWAVARSELLRRELLKKGLPAVDSAVFPEYERRIEAAYDRKNKAFLDAALAACADPEKAILLDKKDEKGNTPLSYALWYDDYDAASKLIKAGAHMTGLQEQEGVVYDWVNSWTSQQANPKRDEVHAAFLEHATDRYLEEAQRSNKDNKEVEKWHARAVRLAETAIHKVAWSADKKFLQSIKEPIVRLKREGLAFNTDANHFIYFINHGNMDVMRALVGMGAVPLTDINGFLKAVDLTTVGREDGPRAKEIMQFLKEQKATVTKNSDGTVPVDLAIERRDINAVRRYIDFGFVYPEGYDEAKSGTPLKRAMQEFAKTKQPLTKDEQDIIRLLTDYEEKRHKASAEPKPGIEVTSVSPVEAFSAAPAFTGVKPSAAKADAPKRSWFLPA